MNNGITKWPYEGKISEVVSSLPDTIGVSTYALYDPNFRFGDPRPPSFGVVFNNGYLGHTAFVDNPKPFQTGLAGNNKVFKT
jgi:hypothetical protein